MSLQAQATVVENFAEKNFLSLNADKCEVVAFCKSQRGNHPSSTVGGEVLPTKDAGRCLGFWWQRDLLATCSIAVNIRKARRAFFLYGNIGAFQGDLSPLSSRSVVESCVMPVLLFGCENWIMTSAMVEELVLSG